MAARSPRRESGLVYGSPATKEKTIPSAHIALRDGLRRAAAFALLAWGVAACGDGSDSAAPTAVPRSDKGAKSSSEDGAAARATVLPTVATSGLSFPTNLTFDRQGGLWVTSGSRGKQPSDGVWYVPRGGRPRHVAKGLTGALGLTWADDRLYVSHITSPSRGRVTVLEGFTGSSFTQRSVAIDRVPVGENSMGPIVQGPDGRLYVKAGSATAAASRRDASSPSHPATPSPGSRPPGSTASSGSPSRARACS